MSIEDEEAGYFIFPIVQKGNFRVESYEAYELLIERLGQIVLEIVEESPELADQHVWPTWTVGDEE